MTEQNGKPSGGYSEVFACPADYVPTRFFQKYNIGFVPPVYRDSLIAIGRSTRVNVVQLWGWTFDGLSERVGIGTDTRSFSRYTQDHRDGNIMCASSRVSEVFKSSYLRVLEAGPSSPNSGRGPHRWPRGQSRPLRRARGGGLPRVNKAKLSAPLRGGRVRDPWRSESLRAVNFSLCRDPSSDLRRIRCRSQHFS